MAIQVTSSTAAPSSPPVTIQRSPWYSPVPYLFGGLAAMLILIAFALAILAYSYWQLSKEINSGNDVDGDLESGSDDCKPENYKEGPVFEEKYFVIMAGHAKPTFLATPISGQAAGVGCSSSKSNSIPQFELDMTEEKEKQENRELVDRFYYE